MIHLLSPWTNKLTERINELEALLNDSSEDFSKSNQKVEAISRSMAVVEFDVEGHILNANKNFLDTVGYELSEIVGKHHRMFVTPEHKSSVEYLNFVGSTPRGRVFVR